WRGSAVSHRLRRWRSRPRWVHAWRYFRDAALAARRRSKCRARHGPVRGVLTAYDPQKPFGPSQAFCHTLEHVRPHGVRLLHAIRVDEDVDNGWFAAGKGSIECGHNLIRVFDQFSVTPERFRNLVVARAGRESSRNSAFLADQLHLRHANLTPLPVVANQRD